MSVTGQFKSRYHEARMQYMATGHAPTCAVISSEKPYWQNQRLVFPFLIDQWQYAYYVDFPKALKQPELVHPTILLGIAMAEMYRLCEVCTPQVVKVTWYACPDWEVEWWNEDLYWYLQQKFYLEKWHWDNMPRIEFCQHADIKVPDFAPLNDTYLLAVSGGKESTFAFEWMHKAKLPIQAFTLHNAGGVLGDNWLKKFPVFDYIKSKTELWEIQAHPQKDPALHFDYQGVRNDPTITNALFIMMIVAMQEGHRFLVLANDKSANESNATYLGREVNHQSAKGATYIARFNDFLERKGLPFTYLSICEEVYSIATVEQLALWNKSLLRDLASCNEAQWAPGDVRWCCNCPKCAFSYALIEAATDARFAIQVVGEDLFTLKKLEAIWQGLFDPQVEKPFECVGEKRETLMALAKCKKRRMENGEPLGILSQIPEVAFDEALLAISTPQNFLQEHQAKLNNALAD